MSARGRWFITSHAVRRYIERHRPGVSYERALYELTLWSELDHAKVVKTRTGDDEHCAEWPARIRFVVTRNSEGPLPALATVLRGNRRTRWLNLRLEVEMEFERQTNTAPRWWDDLQSVMRPFKAARRAAYAMDRRDGSLDYRRVLARARRNGTKRYTDPDRRAVTVAAQRMAHTERREDELAQRPPCPECGGPLQERARMGRVPTYCSRACTARASRRAYWRRRNKDRARSGGLRAGRVWTERELALVLGDAPAVSIAERIGRSTSAVAQKRRQLMTGRKRAA